MQSKRKIIIFSILAFVLLLGSYSSGKQAGYSSGYDLSIKSDTTRELPTAQPLVMRADTTRAALPPTTPVIRMEFSSATMSATWTVKRRAAPRATNPVTTKASMLGSPLAMQTAIPRATPPGSLLPAPKRKPPPPFPASPAVHSPPAPLSKQPSTSPRLAASTTRADARISRAKYPFPFPQPRHKDIVLVPAATHRNNVAKETRTMPFNTEITVGLIALIGAALSAWAAYRGSKAAAESASAAQLKATAQTAFISARLNAALEYEAAFERWCIGKDRDSAAALYRAENVLRLVASEDAIFCVSKLTAYVRQFECHEIASVPIDDIQSAHATAITALRKDIHSYPIPVPELGN